MKELFSMITQLVAENKNNQAVLFSQLDLLVGWFNYGVGVANTIAAIFKNNRELCERLPSHLIYAFGGVLQRRSRGFLPHQLSFLQSAVCVGERSILTNKMTVAEMLKNPAYNQVLHLMKDHSGRARRLELLKNFTSWKQLAQPEMFRKWTGDDAELMYCNKSYELVGLLCIGEDSSGTSAWVQAQMAAEELAVQYLEIHDLQTRAQEGVMDDEEDEDDGERTKRRPPPAALSPRTNTPDVIRMCRTLKSSMIQLFHYCHYHTEIHDEMFLNSELHVQLIDTLVNELEDLCFGQDLLMGAEEDFVHRGLRSLNAFLEFAIRKTNYDGSTPEEMKFLVNKKMLGFLIRVLGRYESRKLKVTQAPEVFCAEVRRLIGWIRNDSNSKGLRVPTNSPDESSPGAGGLGSPGGAGGPHGNAGKSGMQFFYADGMRMATTVYDNPKRMQDDWAKFINYIAKNEKIQEAIQNEQDLIIETMVNILNESDPTEASYAPVCAKARRRGDPRYMRGKKYRRNKITLEDVLGRFVKHAMETLQRMTQGGEGRKCVVTTYLIN